VKNFVNLLASQPVTYPDDYQQLSQHALSRVPVLSVDLPHPPQTKAQVNPGSASIVVIIKSLKPLKTFSITVQPTDTISSIKSHLASQPGAPPADTQRLLLRGKALADGKLLKEYQVKEGDTINLMVKPGYEWDPVAGTETKKDPEDPAPEVAFPAMAHSPSPPPELKLVTSTGHSRAPSIVLSPSPAPSVGPSPSLESKPLDIPLVIDASTISTLAASEPPSSYHASIAKPEYWERLHAFLKSELSSEMDALQAFEDYLRASKGTLTANEVAKIRDELGVVGMAGT